MELFLTLQTNPEYIAKLTRLVSQKEIDGRHATLSGVWLVALEGIDVAKNIITFPVVRVCGLLVAGSNRILYVYVHLRLIKVFITRKSNMIWR